MKKLWLLGVLSLPALCTAAVENQVGSSGSTPTAGAVYSECTAASGCQVVMGTSTASTLGSLTQIPFTETDQSSTYVRDGVSYGPSSLADGTCTLGTDLTVSCSVAENSYGAHMSGGDGTTAFYRVSWGTVKVTPPAHQPHACAHTHPRKRINPSTCRTCTNHDHTQATTATCNPPQKRKNSRT